MPSALNSNNIIDTRNPVNRLHSLNRGTLSWHLGLANLTGGVKFLDLMGLNHGTLTNMGTGSGWSPTARQGGFSQIIFDGTNDTIDCGTAYPMFGTGDFTLAAWVFVTAGVNATHGIFERGNTPVTRLLEFKLQGSPEPNTGSLVFDLYDGVNNPSVSSVVDYRGAWHHFVVTKQPSGAGGFTIYVDGKNVGNTATYTIGTYENAADSFLFGKRTDYGTYLAGKGDDFHVWKRALTSLEVKSYYDLSRMGYPGLLNYVRTVSMPAVAAAGVVAGPYQLMIQPGRI